MSTYSTYSLKELLALWERGKLSAEQARPQGTRHLFQQLAALEARLRQLEKRLPTQG